MQRRLEVLTELRGEGVLADLGVVFLLLESRLSSPLMPLGICRKRNVSGANVVGVLMAAGMFAYFFLSAL